jgi:hypothetical protein
VDFTLDGFVGLPDDWRAMLAIADISRADAHTHAHVLVECMAYLNPQQQQEQQQPNEEACGVEAAAEVRNIYDLQAADYATVAPVMPKEDATTELSAYVNRHDNPNEIYENYTLIGSGYAHAFSVFLALLLLL